ncbi:MAG: extracellular solute-binding protein, partial [SAR202 cluster bacterium]|nr:extracellular solute-binding protein [SAR202 cluster bacterium]
MVLRGELTRRDLLRASGAVASGGLLAACFPGAQTSAPPAQTGPVAATSVATTRPQPTGVVKFWHVWGGERKPIMDKMIANFRTVMPGITIEDTVLPTQGLNEKYLTAIAGGTAPEILMMTTQALPAFAAKGSLRGVEDLLQRDKIVPKQEIYPGKVDMATYRGKLYGLPGVAAGPFYLLFWNKDHYREVGLDPEKGPTTWDEFNAHVKRLTKRTGNDIQRIGALYWRGQAEVRQWMHSNNGGLFSADGRKVEFNRKENIETLAWMVSSLQEQFGGYEKIRAFATDATGGSSAE